ncbi:MAG: UDP-glucose 4-epimerase GalE [Candidatus Dojkabacteria bacterium]|nr:UDP-glucose 4-epimerase GalE [Candidatus Dojkabacteria bacterium]
MNVLVTGGAGYIASHVIKYILVGKSNNFSQIVVLDNLSTGSKYITDELHKIASENDMKFKFYLGDVSDIDFVESLLDEYQFDVIMHFAASLIVPESVADPLKYYYNNVVNTIRLLDLAIKHKVKYFLFSSTASQYSNENVKYGDKFSEDHPINPVNPYARTKNMCENIIRDCSNAYGIKYVILRYFNVAGADIENRIGQSTPNSTHLMKVAAQTALGIRDKLTIFGTDYPTPDGTCIRDYIHVDDLASAHVCALNYVVKYNSSELFNCGYGKGYSVKQVVDTMKAFTGIDFLVEYGERRAGDPAYLVADSTKLKSLVGWKPKYDDISIICKSAYDWERKLLDLKLGNP